MTAHTAPDTKALVMDYLAGALPVPVVSIRPDGGDAPTKFVRVLVTGGAGRSQQLLTRTQVTVDAYAPTGGAARDLAATVEALVHDLPATPVPVAAVTGTTPTELPDPDTASPRWTATYTLTTRIT